MKIEVVIGTRPEIIKMAPVIRVCQAKDNIELRLTHTGQHYDINMSALFFSELMLPSPNLNLCIGSGSQSNQTAQALLGLEQDFIQWKPDVVIAEGDTNAVLSAALAAVKLGIPFAHVEAGIRSYDRSMPEEINRILSDQCSEFCFAPTETAKSNLLKEGIRPGIIHVTGNTVVDALIDHVDIARNSSTILQKLNIKENYAVATIHRPGNTDTPQRLTEIINGLGNIQAPVVMPTHPRTASKLSSYQLHTGPNIVLTEPLGYLDFLTLLANARVVITDSGGIQEEASVLEVPCITVRDNTERPETIEAGVNILVRANAKEITANANSILLDVNTWSKMRGKPELYGDGKASQRIVDIILRY